MMLSGRRIVFVAHGLLDCCSVFSRRGGSCCALVLGDSRCGGASPARGRSQKSVAEGGSIGVATRATLLLQHELSPIRTTVDRLPIRADPPDLCNPGPRNAPRRPRCSTTRVSVVVCRRRRGRGSVTASLLEFEEGYRGPHSNISCGMRGVSKRRL